MKLTRHFFISDDLDDLERLEQYLERDGVVTPQIHALSLNDGDADRHQNLNKVASLMRRDLIHSTLIGAAVGLCASIIALLVAYLAGWTATAAGWIPFIFLAIILLGFFTWQGGLRGIDTPNVGFQRFEQALEAGRHVFFVDLEPHQASVLKRALSAHPTVEAAGTGRAARHWMVFWQHRVRRFFGETFP